MQDTWSAVETLGTAPSKRHGHTSNLYGSTMVMFAGEGSAKYNDVWTVDMETLSWNKLTTSNPKPSARSQHGSIIYGDDLIIYGGYNGNLLNDVWTLNLHTMKWTNITTVGHKPPARAKHTCVLYKHLMIVYGGTTAILDGDVYVLNLKTWAWRREVMTLKPSARENHVALVYDSNQMLIHGGNSSDTNSALDDAWTLNLDTWVWAKRIGSGTNRPQGLRRSEHSATILSGKREAIIFGGSKDGFVSNEVLRLDLSSWNWENIYTTGKFTQLMNFNLIALTSY